MLVDQTDEDLDEDVPRLSAPYKSRTIAVVHRDADVTEASQAITTSRLSPHNTSPYSPSLVRVHQAAVPGFRRACLEYSEEFPSPYANKSACKIAGNKIDVLLKEAESQGVVKIFHNARSGLSLIEVQPTLHR
jgi:hypothetical protein